MIRSSNYVWTLDGVAASTGSPSTPGSMGLPTNFYIVIDSISVGITANGAGDYYASLKSDDAVTLMNIGKTFLAGETDAFHITFPHGLPIPKQMAGTGATGSTVSRHLESTYSSSALFTAVGTSPTAFTICVSYRYVAPSAIGV